MTYEKDEFDNLNRGADKGRIVYADMNIQDDTEPINDTQRIYMVSGFGASTPTSLNDVTDDKLQAVEIMLNKIDGINQDDIEGDDDFFDQANNENNLNDTDQA